MNILFMGTPDFAVFSLRAICEAGEDRVIGVVTQPDKPKGRGYTMTPPPVKVYALEQNLPVYQPNTLRDESFWNLLTELNPDVIIVVAYGKILSESILNFPKHGCINVHGSLLPRYRGAAPIQRAILEGEKKTGVTIMQMDAGIDTGDMFLTSEIDITEEDTFESVHDKLGECGAKALLEALRQIGDGTATRTPQNDEGATYAAKITKGDCLINFAQNAHTVHNTIRGLSPFPLAFTHTPDGKLLKVTSARADASYDTKGVEPGTVLACDEAITVACAEGAIVLTGVLPEGKGRMPAADFVRGRKIAVGDRLS